ncbi:MAG TPA: hypothetical protein VH277_20110 [Gemmatimonadaceae bacterium]|jgi:hypothetical protein|nr:hypothetical protein [Gemmatimonadaceae bacterium]
MSDSEQGAAQGTARRQFLGQIAASALVLAGGACATPAAVASGGTQGPGPTSGTASRSGGQTAWDDTWTTRLTAKHKAVFDSPEIDDGLALSHATSYVRAMHDALGSDDAQTVVVIRHHAIPLIFNDAMWTKYPIGEDKNVKDRSGQWATKNPHTSQIATQLLARGHIVLGCDLATRNYSGVLAGKAHGDRNAIYEELKANLIPGVILQPTGVYAAHRAQEVGCTYIRST